MPILLSVVTRMNPVARCLTHKIDEGGMLLTMRFCVHSVLSSTKLLPHKISKNNIIVVTSVSYTSLFTCSTP